MRKAKFQGWIIFDEDECNHGDDIISQIEHELYNVDGAIEWDLQEFSNEKVEIASEDI